MLFSAKEKILFIGDSITDCGRRTEAHKPLGNGYVKIITGMLDACYGDYELEYHNRGIGGNTIFDLQSRWQEDCIELGCDWVSILIGINDVHKYISEGAEKFRADKFKASYRDLIEKVVRETDAKLILWEPFYFVTSGSTTPKVAEYIGDYIQSVNSLADEFSDRVVGVIHTQTLFAEASQRRWIEFWIPEGVHPSYAGHSLMACEFLRFVDWKLER